MPDSTQRRQSRRYPIQLPLLHRPIAPTPTGGGVAWTSNLSEGGACVEGAEPLQPRTPLRVRLRTDRGAIEAEAQVVWAQGGPPVEGANLHGVAFIQIAPDQLQALRDVILTEGVMRRAGVRLPCEVAVACQPRGEARPPLQGRTRDISRGGLLLRLPQVLPPGTVLEITLHTPTGPLTAEGAIVWVAPPEGRTPGEPIRHGLQFTTLDWSTALSLGLLLVESV